MRTSIDGMIAILKSEAVVLSSYDDGTGVMTIGVGHTAAAGQPVPQPGLKLTLRQALQLFIQDLSKFERGVLRAIDKVPLQQHEFDGFVSFHFNTGQVEKGTVDDKWERGDKTGAMKTLKAYTKADGKELKALKARRQEEAAIIMNGEYPKVHHVTVAAAWKRGRGIDVRFVPVDEIKAVLRELLQPAPSPAPEPKKSEPAQIQVETPQETGAGKAAAGGIAGGVAAGAAAAANGIPWPWILFGAGCVVAIIFIAILIAKGQKS